MDLLEDRAVLEERLDEKHALDENKPKLVENFICAFCTNFSKDPLMCDRCENVFCEKNKWNILASQTMRLAAIAGRYRKLR